MGVLQETLASIGFDWQVALANFVNFMIVLIVLLFFVFKPIKRNLDERKRVIDEGLKKAEDAETSLTGAQEEAMKIKKEASLEAQGIVGEAHDKRQQIMDDAGVSANQKINTMVADAEVRLEKDRVEKMNMVRDEAVDLVSTLANKVFKEEMTEEMKDAFNKRAVSELEKIQ